ncbi:MAG: hypothetical protein WC711_00655 [Candidatus Staskawiczbacteria bacterium]|jgi:hypothetical protein
MKNIKFNLILFVAIILVAVFGLQFASAALVVWSNESPDISTFNLEVKETNGNELTGEFTITNREDYYLSDLNYEIKLFKGNSYSDFKLMDVLVNKEIFFVAPRDTITKTFKYTYPKNITAGDYILRAQVMTSRGRELPWDDLIIQLSGENKFLDILSEYSKVIVDVPIKPQKFENNASTTNQSAPAPINESEQESNNSRTSSSSSEAAPSVGEPDIDLPENVLTPPLVTKPSTQKVTPSSDVVILQPIKGRTEYKPNPEGLIIEGDAPLVVGEGGGRQVATPLEGILVSAGDDIYAYLKVNNPGEAITVKPHIKIFNRQTNMSIAKEYDDAEITFAKGETKEISLTLPKLEKPESYLAEVKFYKNNEQVSGIQYFRWVVRGLGGKILYVKADKDYYNAGDSINLKIQIAGPADTSNPGMGQLEVSVNRKIGGNIAKVSQEVPLGQGVFSADISIPVKLDVVAPVINVKLMKDGQILDEQNINLPVFSKEAKKIKQTQIIVIVAVVAVILLLIIITIWIFYKRKYKGSIQTKKFLLILVISLSFFVPILSNAAFTEFEIWSNQVQENFRQHLKDVADAFWGSMNLFEVCVSPDNYVTQVQPNGVLPINGDMVSDLCVNSVNPVDMQHTLTPKAGPECVTFNNSISGGSHDSNDIYSWPIVEVDVKGNTTLEFHHQLQMPVNIPCGVYNLNTHWEMPVYEKGSSTPIQTDVGDKDITVIVGRAGVCGSANGVISTTAPTSNLCADGRASNVASIENNWRWTCDTSDQCAGPDAECSAPKVAVTVECGANAKTYLATDTSFKGDFCTNGVISNPSNPPFPTSVNPTTTWICPGSPSVECRAVISGGSCL